MNHQCRNLRNLIFGSLLAASMPTLAAEKTIDCTNGKLKVDLGTNSAQFIDRKTTSIVDVYGGDQKIIDIAICRGGVVTAFSGGGVYYSPTCLAIGRDGSQGTKRIYEGTQVVRSMRPLQEEVEIKFADGGNYKTKNCMEAGVHRVD